MTRKKIIILDDEPLIPALIKEMIEEEHGFEISHRSCNLDKTKFLQSVGQDPFDVALIDISVGGREGGIELLQTLKDRDIRLPSIMLSAHDERIYAFKNASRQAPESYVSKNCICTDLMTGLKEVLEGNLFISGEKGKGSFRTI